MSSPAVVVVESNVISCSFVVVVVVVDAVVLDDVIGSDILEVEVESGTRSPLSSPLSSNVTVVGRMVVCVVFKVIGVIVEVVGALSMVVVAPVVTCGIVVV